MSSSQDPGNKHAALEKAQEARRLLVDGLYQEAITTCDEAIQLDPANPDPYRTRLDAYRFIDRSSPLELMRDILVYASRYTGWAFESADNDHPPPEPRFREGKRKLIQHQHKRARRDLKYLEADQREARRKSVQLSDVIEAQQPAQRRKERIEKSTQAHCTTLRNLGVNAYVLERTPIRREEDEKPLRWIEISGSPIRWAHVTPDLIYGVSDLRIDFLVPDSRFGLNGPHVSVVGLQVSSAIPFRRPKSGRWVVDALVGEGFDDELDVPIDTKFSFQIAGRLMETADAIEEALAGVSVQTHLTHGCWTIAIYSGVLNRRVWNPCEAISKALLAMPLPPKE